MRKRWMLVPLLRFRIHIPGRSLCAHRSVYSMFLGTLHAVVISTPSSSGLPGSGKTHLFVKIMEHLAECKRAKSNDAASKSRQGATLVIVPSIDHFKEVWARCSERLKKHRNILHCPTASTDAAAAKSLPFLLDKLIIKNIGMKVCSEGETFGICAQWVERL